MLQTHIHFLPLPTSHFLWHIIANNCQYKEDLLNSTATVAQEIKKSKGKYKKNIDTIQAVKILSS